MSCDLKLAYKLSRCCQIAFREYLQDDLLAEYPDLINVARLALGHLEAAVFVFNTHSVLVFQNSDDLLDWHVNLDLLPIKGFHGGYYKATRRLVSLIGDKVGRRPFYVTGHSLGGALATIFSLQHMYNPFWLGTYTFASPRVVLPSYQHLVSKRLDNRLFAFQHTQDLLGYLPPFYLTLGEIHWVDSKGLLEKGAARPPIFNLLTIPPKQLVANHQIKAFVKALKKAK